MLKKLRNIKNSKSTLQPAASPKHETPKSERFCENKCLPKDFAEKILDLEIELDKENINIAALRKLLELYADAVEYYESINSTRYLHFKKKMLLLLNRPNVMIALNNSYINGKNNQESFNSNPETKEKRKSKCENTKDVQKEDEFKVKVSSIKKNQWIYEDQMKQILESNEKYLENKLSIIDNQLNSQTSDIRERIKERRTSVHISGKENFFCISDDPNILEEELQYAKHSKAVKSLAVDLEQRMKTKNSKTRSFLFEKVLQKIKPKALKH